MAAKAVVPVETFPRATAFAAMGPSYKTAASIARHEL